MLLGLQMPAEHVLVWVSLFFSIPWHSLQERGNKNRLKIGKQRTLYFKDRNHRSAVLWALSDEQLYATIHINVSENSEPKYLYVLL